MAKWYWLMVQGQGDMPEHYGPFTSTDRMKRVAESLEKEGTPKENMWPISVDFTERTKNIDNLADLSDEELRQF